MHKITKVVFHSIYILAILSLITPLTLNVLVKYDINWKNSGEIEYNPLNKNGKEYEIMASPQITVMNGSNTAYGILWFFSGLLSTDSYYHVLGRTENLREWSEYVYLGPSSWPELQYWREFDLVLLNNGSLLLSALHTNSDLNSTNALFSYMLSNDGQTWFSNLTLGDWDERILSSFDLPYTDIRFGVFEQQGEIKVFTSYIIDTSGIEEMGISIWSLNFTSDSMVRESNFTMPSYSWHIDYISNNDVLYFLYKNSNTTGTIISYDNLTWSVKEFEIEIFYTWFYDLVIQDDKFYILYESGTKKNVHLDFVQLAELVESGLKYVFLQNESKVITKLDTPFATCHLIKESDDPKIIIQDESAYRSSLYYLYEEGFDHSQVLKYSFGVIGLSILAVVPILLFRWKENILSFLKRK